MKVSPTGRIMVREQADAASEQSAFRESAFLMADYLTAHFIGKTSGLLNQFLSQYLDGN